MEAKHLQHLEPQWPNMVLPSENQTHFKTYFGGELLARMDRAASIARQTHSR